MTEAQTNVAHLRLIITQEGKPGWADARPLVDARAWTLSGVWRLWIYHGDGSTLARNINRPELAQWVRQLRRDGWNVGVCRHAGQPNHEGCFCHLDQANTATNAEQLERHRLRRLAGHGLALDAACRASLLSPPPPRPRWPTTEPTREATGKGQSLAQTAKHTPMEVSRWT